MRDGALARENRTCAWRRVQPAGNGALPWDGVDQTRRRREPVMALCASASLREGPVVPYFSTNELVPPDMFRIRWMRLLLISSSMGFPVLITGLAPIHQLFVVP